jgi:hypothetical protein
MYSNFFITPFYGTPVVYVLNQPAVKPSKASQRVNLFIELW